MFPAPFEYHRPSTVSDALGLLERFGEDARCLAGGHSLLPAIKLRLAQPGHLVDLAGISSLRGIDTVDNHLVIGATTTHWEVESSPLVKALLPSLAEAASMIADPQVRNRGTIGGSIVTADPAADYPANILALNAKMICTSHAGSREVMADAWFKGLFTTGLGPGEILTQIRIPLFGGRSGASYVKIPHPASHFAVVGVAVAISLDDEGRCLEARIAINGASEHAVRSSKGERGLIGSFVLGKEIMAAAAALSDEVPVERDELLSESSKRYLCQTTAVRAISVAVSRAKVGATSPD